MEFRRCSSGLSFYDFDLKLEKGDIKRVNFPAPYFQAPQYYYNDQSQINSRPRQLQATLCGRVTWPMPIELPRFTREQRNYSEFLRNSVQVGDVFVSHQTFAEIVRRATIDNSLGPDHTEKPSKGVFHPDNVITTDEALERFDSKYNRSLSKRLSLSKSMEKEPEKEAED